MANGKFSAQTSAGMPTRTERVQQQYEVQKQEAVLAQQRTDEEIRQQKEYQDIQDKEEQAKYFRKQQEEWDIATNLYNMRSPNVFAWRGTGVYSKYFEIVKQEGKPDKETVAKQKAYDTYVRDLQDKGYVVDYNTGQIKGKETSTESIYYGNNPPPAKPTTFSEYFEQKPVSQGTFSKQVAPKTVITDVSPTGKVYNLNIETSTTSMPYQTRGTKSTQQVFNISPYKLKSEKYVPSLPTKWTSTLKNLWTKIPSTELEGILGLTYKFSQEGLLQISKPSEKLNEVRQKLLLSQIPDASSIEAKYQRQYQSTFDNAYSKRITSGELTFEQASAEFEKSRDAKIIGEKYSKEIKQKEQQLPQLTKLVFIATDIPLALLGVGKIGLSLVPKTYKGAVVEAGLGYAGARVITGLPPAVSTAVNRAFIGKGLFDIANPLSTTSQVTSGAMMAGVGLVGEGYGIYKWARSPVLKTEKIIRDIELESSALRSAPATEGFSYSGGKLTVIKTYKATQLSERVVAGQRTVVTTKFRELFGLKPIYKGVPYAELGQTYNKGIMGGLYEWKTPSAYQKAIKKLTSYGLTETKAKGAIRYYQPKVIREDIFGEVKFIYGDAFKVPEIRSEATRKQVFKKIVFDKDLNIKSRGGYGTQEFISGTGRAIASKENAVFYRTIYNSEKALLTKQGYAYNRISQAGKTTTMYDQLTRAIVRGDKTLKISQNIGGLKFTKSIPYEDILQQSMTLKTLPKSRKIITSQSELIALKGEISNILYEEATGLRIKEILEKPKPAKFTPIEKYTRSDLNKLIKDLEGIYGKSAPAQPTQPAQTALVESQLADLKVFDIPATQTRQVGLKQSIKSISKIERDFAGASKGALAMRVTPSLKLSTKLEADLKQILRTSSGLEQASQTRQQLRSRQAVKQTSALRSLLKSEFDVTTTPRLSPPTITPPTRIFAPKMLIFSGEKDLRDRLKQKRMKNELINLGLFPDFTARAFGLSPKELTFNEAIKELNKIQTGFEVRTGARLKGFDERKLLRRVMT